VEAGGKLAVGRMAHLPFVGRGILWVDDDAGSHVEADAEAAAIGGQHLGFGELDAGEGAGGPGPPR
jgi:hypothetical protein